VGVSRERGSGTGSVKCRPPNFNLFKWDCIKNGLVTTHNAHTTHPTHRDDMTTHTHPLLHRDSSAIPPRFLRFLRDSSAIPTIPHDSSRFLHDSYDSY
jgi:hypothetical protein